MILRESIMTKNPCYTTKRSISPRGLMLHSVGVNQPSAEVFIKQWNSPDYSRACVHGFIDANSGVVYQTLPWGHRGWHCGGTGNNTHIGVEMCEPANIHYTGGATFKMEVGKEALVREQVKRTYEAAVELFGYLCKKYSLDPAKNGVIVSHKEGHDLGIATNHGDPEHLWTQTGSGYTMDGFRQDVSKRLSVLEAQIPNSQNSPGGEFQVAVKIDNLNIRSGPGVSYKSLGHTGKGVFTIVETQGSWGLLKSYAKERNGWISLNYANRR